MKKIVTTFVLLFLAHIAYADDDECPAAADAAEAQNHNLYKNCDYSKKGLNGVLHRALAKKTEANEESKETNDAQSEATKVPLKKNQKVVDKVELLTEGEFSSPQQLQSVKFGLLEKLALECTKGFVVEGERYLPVVNSKAMKLELIHHCL